MSSTESVRFSELANFFPRQKEAAEALKQCSYLLYGGAAGGGKSRFLRWMALYLCMYYAAKYGTKGVRVGLFCEDYPALNDRQLSKIAFEFPESLGVMNKSSHEFTLSPVYGGGVIAFRNLDDPNKYLSAEFAAILVDELTRNDRDTFNFLNTRRRWPGVPDTKFVAATNPGGKGHGFVKKLFVDKDFEGEPPDLDPNEFKFVQSKVQDNPYVDPSYVKTLSSLPETLRRAYLEGDWDMFKGQFFTEYRRNVHVIEPFSDPETIQWFRGLPTYCGMDYGYNAPSCVLWGKFYDQTLIIYRELYVTQKTYEELGQIVRKTEIPRLMYADPAIWAKKDSPHSGAEKMNIEVQKPELRIPLRSAMNDRVIGWNFVKQALKTKQIMIFSTCTNLIRTLPSQVYDEIHTEDLDTDGEDHAVDALRYLLATHKTLQIQKTKQSYIPQKSPTPSDLEEIFAPKSSHPLKIKYG